MGLKSGRNMPRQEGDDKEVNVLLRERNSGRTYSSILVAR